MVRVARNNDMKTLATSTTYYRFTQHTRRIRKFIIVAAPLLVVAVALILLTSLNAFGSGQSGLGVLGYILAVPAFVLLVPMLILTREYNRSGIWLDDDAIRVRFPGEKPQEMAWPETRFAINEGEDYLQASKGKEGLGHVVGDTRYLRLHLEGLPPDDRQQAEAALAERMPVRSPVKFTLMTLMNNKGEVQARGRLYLFERDLLCAENRGEKRVFFYAPLKDLSSVKPHNPFYIGRLQFDAFTLRYRGQDYVMMLGYETTVSGNLGKSSHWSVTGEEGEWVEALSHRA
jgi:hypothetical protein